LAIEQPKIIINEIAWMGTNISSSDEWIELYNPTSKAIDIDNWILKTQDENIKITLKGTIPSQGFFLLERTDDNSAPSEKADLIYQGALSNNGETLELVDSIGNVIDKIDNSTKWLFGDNKTKQTMEVCPSSVLAQKTTWHTSMVEKGTPKQPNSQCPESQPITIDSTPQPTTSDAILSDRSELHQVENIFINEVLPSPEGPDTENEFIELFNANNFEVNLSSWKVKDKIGSTKSYSLLENTKIKANGFLVLKSSQTKISLNNSGDGIELIGPNGKIIDSTDFDKAKQGQSWSKIENNFVWSTQPTPNQKNIATHTSQTISTSTLIKTTSSSSKPLGANTQNYPTGHKNLIAVGTATAIALASAVAAWFIKKKSTEI